MQTSQKSLNSQAFILDCTLRDGQYAVREGFDALTTFSVAKALDEAGIPFIEVGHGEGLGCPGSVSDEIYMVAASDAVKHNKWGMFFIPGKGNFGHIDMAHSFGMSFLRIGVNVNEWETSLLVIDKAKACDMFVCVNLMKTYLATPSEVAEIADEIYKRGGDCVYIVDSAGCMDPGEVDEYITAIKLTNDKIGIGFHGHNNLQLAMANTLNAFGSGATMLDTSLRGIGRSAGNCMTEALLINMNKIDVWKEINLHSLYRISAEFIDPLLSGHLLNDNQSLACGKSKIHSSDIEAIYNHADEWGVDRYRFAEKVGDMMVVLGRNRVDKNILVETHSLMLACK